MIGRVNGSADPGERDSNDAFAVLLPNDLGGNRRRHGGGCGRVTIAEGSAALGSTTKERTSYETDLVGSYSQGIHWTDSTSTVIAEVLRCTVSLGSTTSTLQALIGLAMETGPWCAGSITIFHSPEPLSTAAFLGRRAADCDHLQRQLGQGPSHDAVSAAPLQVAEELDFDGRWPDWAVRATSVGIHAAMSLRLFTDVTLGTLNLYAERPLHIDPSVAQGGQVIAAHASTILGHLLIEEQLHCAMKSRTVIGQAQGLLMHRYGLTPQKAFAVLRRISQNNNVKIGALAEELVATGSIKIVDLTLHHEDSAVKTR